MRTVLIVIARNRALRHSRTRAAEPPGVRAVVVLLACLAVLAVGFGAATAGDASDPPAVAQEEEDDTR